MEMAAVMARLALTFVLSLIFGLERQRAHKSTGFGTFIFVAVGSCGLAITANTIYAQNPVPMLSAIVTGIGFLGAGALIKTSDKIFGFTTAASIWLFAIVGLVIGSGEYLTGIALYSTIWVVILFDNYLERKGIGSYRKRIAISTNRIFSQKEIEGLLRNGLERQVRISAEIDKKNRRCCFVYMLEGRKEEIKRSLDSLLEKDWCESIKVE